MLITIIRNIHRKQTMSTKPEENLWKRHWTFANKSLLEKKHYNRWNSWDKCFSQTSFEWSWHIGLPHFSHLGFKFFIGYFFFFWLCPEIWNKQILHRCFVLPNRGYSEALTSMLSLRYLPRIRETLPRRPILNQQCVLFQWMVLPGS